MSLLACLQNIHSRVCRLETEGIRGFIVGVAKSAEDTSQHTIAVVHEISQEENTFLQAQHLQLLINAKTKKEVLNLLPYISDPGNMPDYVPLNKTVVLNVNETTALLNFQHILEIMSFPDVSHQQLQSLYWVAYLICNPVSDLCVHYAQGMLHDFNRYKLASSTAGEIGAL